MADAYLRPRMAAYLEHLGRRARHAGLPAPMVMQSSGGVLDVGVAVGHPARFVLSGPAGGVVGASYVAGLSGFPDVLTFDMGGTSTDVAPVVGGQVQLTTESVVAGVPLRLPMVDVHTVSAGGGSVAWVDEGGALRVGPHSAGADPGPAGYGLGGTEATVTDANLVLGTLPDGARLGGDVVLRRSLAADALSRVGARLGLDAREAALGVVRVADTEMVRALRLISVERGLDPRDFALVAFGGAGGLHACALAEELGCVTVLVPRAAGVLSALGLAISEVRHDHVRPFTSRRDDELEPAFVEAESAALTALPDAELLRQADLRYAGQSFELDRARPHPPRAGGGLRRGPRTSLRSPDRRRADRDRQPAAGRDPSGVVPDLRGAERPGDPGATAGTRRVLLDVGEVEVTVHDRTLMGPGSTVTGPAVVEMPEATCLVRPGWAGRVDEIGTLVLRREVR